MAENAGGVAAPVDHSPSLTSVVGEMFGDYRDAEPEPETGAPPVEVPEIPADSEGTAASEPTGEPPVEAEPETEPDPSTPAVEPDVDVFDGATPLAYTVDGQERSYDGIKILKDGTAVIDPDVPDALDKIQRVFGERDHLFEQSRAQYEKYATLERATAWRTTDASGKEQTLTGLAAAEASRVYTAQMAAKTITYERTIDAIMKDPSHFAKLYEIVTDTQGQYGPAGQQYVIPSQKGFEDLKREAAIFARESALSARSHLSQQAAPPPPAEVPVQDLAGVTIDAIAKQHNVANLSAEDKAFLAGQFPKYVVGQGASRAVDPSFVELVKRTASSASNAAASVTAATTAALANAKKLNAASIGKGGKQAPKIAPKQEPEPSHDDDFDANWDRMQKAGAGALKAHALGR